MMIQFLLVRYRDIAKIMYILKKKTEAARTGRYLPPYPGRRPSAIYHLLLV